MNATGKQDVLAVLKKADSYIPLELRMGKDKVKVDASPHDIDLCIDQGDNHFDLKLTRQGLWSACTLGGMSEGYAVKCPPELLDSHVNYWMENGNKKFLAFHDGTECVKMAAYGHSDHLMGELVEVIEPVVAEAWGADTMYLILEDGDSLNYTNLVFMGSEIFTVGDQEWLKALYVRDSRTGVTKLGVFPALVRVDDNALVIFNDFAGVSERKHTPDYEVDFEEWARQAAGKAVSFVNEAPGKLQKALQTQTDTHTNVFLGGLLRELPVPQSLIQDIVADTDKAQNLYEVALAFATRAVEDDDDLALARRERLAFLASRVVNHSDICPHCHREET